MPLENQNIPPVENPAIGSRGLRFVPRWPGLALLGIVAVLIIILNVAGAKTSLAPPILFPILNTLFIFTTYSIAAYFAATSFLRTGSWHILMFGAGVLILGVSATVAAWISGMGGINAVTQVHNINALVASLLILSVPVLGGKSIQPRKETGRLQYMIAIYMAGVILIALITVLAIGGHLPIFFDASGPTMLRQIIYGMAALLLAVSAVFMALTYYRSRSDFLYWCCLGIALISLGFTAGLLINIMGDTMSWLSRLTLYFSGIYLLVGVIAARAEARTRGSQLHDIIAEFGRQAKINYELLVNAASDAIIAVDGMGRILTWNPAAGRIFGYNRSEAIGSAFFDLLTGPEVIATYQKALDTITHDKPSAIIELTGKKKSGEEFPIELTLAAKSVAKLWLSTTTLIIRDITERKEAEVALKESEEHYRALNETSPVGVGVSSADGVLLYTNPSYELILGYDHGELISTRAIDLYLNPEDRLSWRGTMKESGVVRDVEARLKRKDGTPVWVSINASSITYGGKQAVMGTIQDITERKKAEAEIAYRATFPELDPDPILEMDGDGDVTYMNPAAFKLFPDLPRMGSYLTGLLDMLKDRPTSMWTRDVQVGESWYEQTVFRVPSSQSVRIYGRDITQRKKAEEGLRESEERFRAIAETSPVGIGVAENPGGRFLFVNQAYEKAFGYPAGELLNIGTSDVFPDAADRKRILRALRKNGIVTDYELSMRRKDGSTFWGLAYIRPIIFAGKPALLGAFVDITERKRIEQIKDDFIGMVSHELRTPLTIIMGSIGVARHEGISDDERKELLTGAARSSDNLAHILDNLIELSRYQAKRLTLNMERVDIEEFIKEIVQLERSHTGDRVVLTHTGEKLPEVAVDKVRLQQIIHNLLDNAAKYSPANTEIQVFVREEGQHILVGVGDRGKGISPVDQSRLFQPFERLTETSLTKPGLGLGLMVCQRLVEAHGGKIWVESKPNEGTTFWFALPILS